MEVSGILRRNGLRVTLQRKAVLGLLLKKGSPMSHNEITAALAEPIDKVTLYRILQALKEASVVHQVQGLDGTWRFCAHDSENEGCPGNHPHFLCVDCGKMTCLYGQALQRVEVPDGIEVEGKQFVVYGLCACCTRK